MKHSQPRQKASFARKMMISIVGAGLLARVYYRDPFSLVLVSSVEENHAKAGNGCLSLPVDNATEVDTQSSSDAATITFPSSNFKVVPDRCDSPSRGHFDQIYKKGLWGTTTLKSSDFYGDAHWPPQKTRKISASGLGSDLGPATEASLQIIKDTIAKYNIKTMVDIPCGDVNWIHDSFETDSLPLYVGLDITSAVIEVNKQRFAHHVNKRFYFWDATKCTLPRVQDGEGEEKPFDLVHVRDVIQHMHLDQGVQFFCNVFKSGAQILISTTYRTNRKNNNIHEEGGWYPNNLSAEPFSFPESDNCIPTHPNIEADDTCVYDLSEPWVKDFIAMKCS